MNAFAPGNDGNDPKAYAEAIAKAVGVDATLTLSKLSPDQLNKFVETVKQREGIYDTKGTSEILK